MTLPAFVLQSFYHFIKRLCLYLSFGIKIVYRRKHTMTITAFDSLDHQKKKELLFNCCGSVAWVKSMMEILPVNDLTDLLEYAEEKWYECNGADWLEAFEHHPKIGDLHSSLSTSISKADIYAGDEQAGVEDASSLLLEELAKANEEYEENFGYIFIVFATGKSAKEMLKILRRRINNDPHEELMIAAAEQDKITKLRLQKLFA